MFGFVPRAAQGGANLLMDGGLTKPGEKRFQACSAWGSAALASPSGWH